MQKRKLAVIGGALDLGAGRRGVDMGPSAIRYAGLDDRLARLGLECSDWGNVETVVPEATASGDPSARFLTEIKNACERIARRVAAVAKEGSVPIVLGGDHSIALGTLGGLAATHGAGGVLWFDAHGDLNTPETSPSGNDAFGSDAWPLPAVKPEHVFLIGVRSLDDGERELVRRLGVSVYTMTDLDRRGVEPVVREVLGLVADAGFVHVSLDMDVVDADVAPGVGTPVRGGLSYREAHLAMELVAESGVLGSMDVVEVNPILDRENATAQLAVELVASALGERIL